VSLSHAFQVCIGELAMLKPLASCRRPRRDRNLPKIPEANGDSRSKFTLFGH